MFRHNLNIRISGVTIVPTNVACPGNEELQPSPFGSFMVMIKEQPVWLEDKGQKSKGQERS